MAVNRNFVVKNGFEVSTNLIVADANTKRVGIATTTPRFDLDIRGGIGATDLLLSGIGTFENQLRVGSNGSVFSVLGIGGSVGVGTAIPRYLLDVRSPVSTGQTALYVYGDVRVSGDLAVDDINFDQASISSLFVSGIGTIVSLASSVGIITDLSGSNLNYSGIGTITNLNGQNFNVGVATIGILNASTVTISGAAATDFTVTRNLTVGGIGTIATLNSTTGTVTNLSGTNLNYSGVGTVTTLNSTTGTVTNLSGTNLNYNGIGTVTNLSGTNLNYSGVGTVTTLNSTTGTIANLSGTNLNYSGVGTIGNILISSGIVTAVSGIVTYYGDGRYLQNVISGVGINTEGGNIGYGATLLDFRGSGISTVTVSSGIATIYVSGGGGGGTPGGSDGQVQYNSSGTFAGSSNLIFDGTTVTVGSAVSVNSSGINTPTGIITASSFSGNLSNTLTLSTSGTGLSGSASYNNSGVTTFTVTSNATSSNTVSTLVARDGSGNFSAGTITASLSGTATNATNVAITDNNSTNSTYYPTFVPGTSGNQGQTVSSTKLTYNPSSGTFGAISFSGSGASLTSLNASNLSSGTVATARLASGTANSTTFLRGDQTWASVSTSLAITDDNSTNSTFYPTFTSATSGSISGESVSSSKLTFNPSTGTLTATDINSTSDVNLKTNISTIENSLQTIQSLRGVSFDWKDNGKKSYGVIAQELEQVLPELVNTTDVKSVNHNGIIGFLIEAVKELSLEIEALKKAN